MYLRPRGPVLEWLRAVQPRRQDRRCEPATDYWWSKNGDRWLGSLCVTIGLSSIYLLYLQERTKNRGHIYVKHEDDAKGCSCQLSQSPVGQPCFLRLFLGRLSPPHGCIGGGTLEGVNSNVELTLSLHLDRAFQCYEIVSIYRIRNFS